MPGQNSGTGRPFVVHFANPRKASPGLPADPGLAPRKLFVGQVGGDASQMGVGGILKVPVKLVLLGLSIAWADDN